MNSIFSKLFGRKDKPKRVIPETLEREDLLDTVASEEIKRVRPKIVKLDKADIKLREMVRKALKR